MKSLDTKKVETFSANIRKKTYKTCTEDLGKQLKWVAATSPLYFWISRNPFNILELKKRILRGTISGYI